MSKWEMVRLEQALSDTVSGEWGTDCDNICEGTKVLRTTNFTNRGVVDYSNVVVRNIPKTKVEMKRLLKGDIILEKSGGSDNQPVGRVVFYDNDEDIFLCNNFTQILRTDGKIAFNKYVFYFLFNAHRIGTTELLQNKTTGIRNLQLKSYMSIPLPLPSLSVQLKIADVLDRASILIEKRKAQIEKLDLLVKSQFIVMFGDPMTNPMGWEVEPLSKHLRVVGGFAFSSKGFRDKGIPVLRIGNINTGVFSRNNLVFWQQSEKLDRFLLRPGDIVISLTGTVGKDDYANTCILGYEFKNYYLNQRNAKLELFDALNKYYLANALKFPKIKGKLTGISRGIRQANVSNGDILNLTLPIPPIEMQINFAAFVERVEAHKTQLKKSLDLLELNYESLMQKCFAGEIF